MAQKEMLLPEQQIEVERIRPNPDNPRTKFAGIPELGASLIQHTMLQPVVVVPDQEKGQGFYVLEDGERRWQAAQLAKLKRIPARVKIGRAHV